MDMTTHKYSENYSSESYRPVKAPEQFIMDSELDNLTTLFIQVGSTPTFRNFWGGFINFTSQSTVMEAHQAQISVETTENTLSLRMKKKNITEQIRFGGVNDKSVVILQLSLPVADAILISFDAYVIPIDI